MRFDALFLLLFTTSGNVFKAWWSLRDAVNFRSCEMVTRQMHENKQKVLLLAMASEPYPSRFELQIWLRFKLEILQSQLPRRHLKTRHSDVDFSDLGLFFMLLSGKKSKPTGYTRTMYSQTGENMK